MDSTEGKKTIGLNPERRNPRPFCESMHSQIMALKSDLSALINQFAEKQSLNYVDFVSVWLELGMSEMIVIATGQRPNRELRMIIEGALNHAAAVFSDSVDIKWKQYGAFYLLYALYFVQPTIPKIKIRLTYDMWVKFQEMVDDAVENEQWDAVYTGGVLVEAKAFHFVTTLVPLVPEHNESKKKVERVTAAKAMATSAGVVPCSAPPLPNVDALLKRLARDTDEFDLAQSEYVQAKQALGSLRLPGLDRADSGIANDILSKIRKLVDS